MKQTFLLHSSSTGSDSNRRITGLQPAPLIPLGTRACYAAEGIRTLKHLILSQTGLPIACTTAKRRRRDSNPRAGFPTYRISSADPSTTWVLLHITMIPAGIEPCTSSLKGLRLHHWTKGPNITPRRLELLSPD